MYKDASFEEGKEESLKPKIMIPLAESDKKETKVKVSKRDEHPKSQNAAVMEMAKTMKEATDLQEKNNDQRLTTLLEAESKRDDMFLTFQREQAEANTKHDMLMTPNADEQESLSRKYVQTPIFQYILSFLCVWMGKGQFIQTQHVHDHSKWFYYSRILRKSKLLQRAKK